MKKIAIIYPAMVSADAGPNRMIKEAVGDCQVTTILDDSIIADVVANGGLNEDIRARMLYLYMEAEKRHPNLIVCACSSIGETVYLARQVIQTPIIRIDDAMARRAVKEYTRIGIMATLPTTLDPTCSLINRIADETGKQVSLTSRVAEGAFEATAAGDLDKAEQIMTEVFCELAEENEVILFAQGSMAVMKERLSRLKNIPVFTSPEYCAEQIKEMFAGGQVKK